MIQFTVTSLELDRSRGSFWQGFRSVMALGARHIAGGADHLMFLFTLLLPAPLLASGRSWAGFAGMKPSFGKLARIVTAFAIGHSITLLIGGMGWLHLPTKPVQVLIGISILVSAIHAIKPWFAGKEAWVAGGFGLVHGLAFAGSISEFGFSPWHMATSILGFNLGVEAMQLAIVFAIMPCLLILSQAGYYRFMRNVGAVLAALAALAWTGARLNAGDGSGLPGPQVGMTTAP